MTTHGALAVGDTVAIRGDKRWNHQLNVCCYLPEQLVDGKYVKNTRTGEIWTGKITKFNIDGTMASLGSGYWWVGLLEKLPTRGEE